MHVELVRICDISVSPDRREIKPEALKLQIKSMSEMGLINPITVNAQKELIAGLHRLEAAKALGWTEIKCSISTFTGIEAKLAEIDENVVRANLTSMELSRSILKRKELYEELHPETKAGTAQGVAMNRALGNNVEAKFAPTLEATKPFYKDTAEKLSMSPRKVKMLAQIGKNLTQEAQNVIQDSGMNVTQQNLYKLSRLAPKAQCKAAKQLVDGTISSVDQFVSGAEEVKQADASVENCTKKKSDTKTSCFEPGNEKNVEDSRQNIPPYRTTEQIIADLKRTDKENTCTPEEFLCAIIRFVEKFCKEIEGYRAEDYIPAYRMFTIKQLSTLRSQMQTICTYASNLYQSIEREVKNESSQET